MGVSDPHLLNKKKSDGGGDSKAQESIPSKDTKHLIPQSPKPGRRSPIFRRNGSLGKGPHKTTVPQGFKLATEARSLVRPCGCGKDGVFGAHGHTHGHGHHKKVPALPEITNRGVKTQKSPQVARKTKDAVPVVEPPKPTQAKNHQTKQTVPPKKSPPKTSSLPVPATITPLPRPKESLEEEGTNRFVSTVVWYPEMQPAFNFTRLNLSPGEDTHRVLDEILVKEYDSYLKKRLPASDREGRELDGPLHVKRVQARNFGNMIEGCLSSSNVNVNPVSIS